MMLGELIMKNKEFIRITTTTTTISVYSHNFSLNFDGDIDSKIVTNF